MLSINFEMQDFRVADVILGIKIIRTPDGISLSQSHYVDKMIERFKDHGINVTPQSRRYGDVMATYIREVKTTSRVR